MKISIACALILVVSAGCTPPAEPKPAPEPVKETKVETPEPPKDDPSKKPGYKAERLNQLVDLESDSIKVGGKAIRVWLMNDDSKKQEGMMFLGPKDVADDQGMLFVFDREEQRSFWMANTTLPLDLAYISKTGRVVSVHKMKALDETPVPSAGPAKYVLEMKQGCFTPFGIQAGTKLEIPERIKAKE